MRAPERSQSRRAEIRGDRKDGPREQQQQISRSRKGSESSDRTPVKKTPPQPAKMPEPVKPVQKESARQAERKKEQSESPEKRQPVARAPFREEPPVEGRKRKLLKPKPSAPGKPARRQPSISGSSTSSYSSKASPKKQPTPPPPPPEPSRVVDDMISKIKPLPIESEGPNGYSSKDGASDPPEQVERSKAKHQATPPKDQTRSESGRAKEKLTPSPTFANKSMSELQALLKEKQNYIKVKSKDKPGTSGGQPLGPLLAAAVAKPAEETASPEAKSTPAASLQQPAEEQKN